MSLDACFLSFLTKQLNSELVGSRVDKIYMPSRDETVFLLRGITKHKLLINVSTNAPRLALTDTPTDNPPVPPTFCMFLRKHFMSARVKRVYMPSFERAVVIDFECKNDFFEPCDKSIIIELMGRSANMIAVENGKILDAVRHCDLSSGSARCILPSAKYESAPLQQGKTPFTDLENIDVIYSNRELTLDRAIMDNISGISPVAARELCYLATGKTDKHVFAVTDTEKKKLKNLFDNLKTDLESGTCTPTVITRRDNGKLVDFTFMPITQYGDFCTAVSYKTPSEAICAFFDDAAKKARFEHKTRDLSQFLTRTSARITRTLKVREKELASAENADKYRVYGELINANLYRMQKGETVLLAQNYYDNCNEIKIPLRAELSPSQNAAAYFKKYNKAKNSIAVLTDLIKKDRQELSYLESVFMSLCDCEEVKDAEDIRTELERGGYLRKRSRIKRSDSPSEPRRFEKDGFTILVGRNNIQNDLVTVKLSRRADIWLHTKNIHSSHVLICCGANTPSDSTIEYAARLCAYYSKAKDDLKVEVDYCPVGNVKKPVGAKPGMVVYDNYNTVVVKPFTKEELK